MKPPSKLHTEWAEVENQNHLFASRREGLISICGAQRYPKKTGESVSAPYCFLCVAQLRIILNPEKYAAR